MNCADRYLSPLLPSFAPSIRISNSFHHAFSLAQHTPLNLILDVNACCISHADTHRSHVSCLLPKLWSETANPNPTPPVPPQPPHRPLYPDHHSTPRNRLHHQVVPTAPTALAPSPPARQDAVPTPSTQVFQRNRPIARAHAPRR